ncbi:hypothetical protein [Chamaesiphon minutus]|nr:hypothetical protein [Chamaesiphon minutus]
MSKQWWKVSLLGIVMVVAGCSTTTKPEVAVSTSPVPVAAPKDVWMNQFEQLNGTPYLYAPIYVAEQERKSILKQIKSASYSSYDERKDYQIDIRNYMFVHRDNLSAGKLLTNNNSRILELEQIGEPFPPSKSNTDAMNRPSGVKTVKTLWYVRAEADTNADKLLSDLDRKQIGISDVSGANYTEVIKDIDKILLVSRLGIDRRVVIYTSGDKRFVANIDIPTRKATIKELPPIN